MRLIKLSQADKYFFTIFRAPATTLIDAGYNPLQAQPGAPITAAAPAVASAPATCIAIALSFSWIAGKMAAEIFISTETLLPPVRLCQ
jgi:hypothetical protein